MGKFELSSEAWASIEAETRASFSNHFRQSFEGTVYERLCLGSLFMSSQGGPRNMDAAEIKNVDELHRRASRLSADLQKLSPEVQRFLDLLI